MFLGSLRRLSQVSWDTLLETRATWGLSRSIFISRTSLPSPSPAWALPAAARDGNPSPALSGRTQTRRDTADEQGAGVVLLGSTQSV